jgi:hypothetical protein
MGNMMMMMMMMMIMQTAQLWLPAGRCADCMHNFEATAQTVPGQKVPNTRQHTAARHTANAVLESVQQYTTLFWRPAQLLVVQWPCHVNQKHAMHRTVPTQSLVQVAPCQQSC